MGINPILKTVQYNDKDGSLVYNEIRYMLIRPETIVEIQKTIMTEYGAKAAQKIFYQSGFKGTSLTTKKLLEKGLTPDQCIQEMFEMGAQLGWGRFKILKINASWAEIKVKIQSSPFAQAFGPSDIPTCPMLCGALAGIFSSLTGNRYICHETECVASGHSGCYFTIKQISE